MRNPLLLAIYLSAACLFPSERAQASDFWDEVRQPGLRVWRQAIGRAANALTTRRFAVALEAADEAIAALPDRALGHAHRARALGELERNPDALSAFERALELDPEVFDEPRVGTRVGTLLARAGNHALAAKVLERVLGRMPRAPNRRGVFVLHADMLLALGPDHLTAAIRSYREALRSSPVADVRANVGLALALLRSGERDEAMALARQVAGAGRINSVVNAAPLPPSERAARRALVFSAIDNADEARAAWEAAADGPWADHARSMNVPTRARRRRTRRRGGAR